MSTAGGTGAPPRCFGWKTIRVACVAMSRLPQWALLALGRALAVPLGPLMRSRWRIAQSNLALCLPDDDDAARRVRLRAHQRSLPIAVLEVLRACFAPRERLAGLADVEGLGHLEDARAAGQGVLLLTGHLMHGELAVRFLVEAGAGPIACVVRRYHAHPCLERLIDAARRARLGPTLGKFDTRAMVRTLREGRWLAYSADQDFRTNHVFVPFFGVRAATLASIPQLARAGRARVRFFAMARGADGRYRVRIEDPGLDALLDDPPAFAARYMQVLETAVRDAPDQYLWVHRRFKTRPPGEPPLYSQA